MATTPTGTTAEQAKAKIEVEGVIDPKETDKLLKSVLGPEQAPTSADQTPDTATWQRMRDVLGPPFDSERVTLAQMRQLRKDPMVAFGLHYRKVPIARAEWYVEARDKNGINAQVQAFVHACLSLIWTRYIFQRTLCLDFGYQAMVKRYIFANPGGVYFDPLDKNTDPTKRVKPIWDEGNVLPKIWKAPVALRPELVQPQFDDKTGEFNGIIYQTPAAQRRKTTGFASSQGQQGQQVIDIYHALWATNQKDNEHGSIFGYPLTGYARNYWWQYGLLYGLNSRAFERLAIPPIMAFHPPGNTVVDEFGTTRPNWEIALEMAERLRSNAVAAVPSTMAEAGVGETSATQRAWDFKFLETPYQALDVFDSRFNYLNVMKLRSIWVPELAFTGGEVGRSGGNLAEQMAEVFTQSQALLMDEGLDEINRYMVPQLLWLNFPEFINNGGKAIVKSRGFRSEDMELYKQVIQLLGQANAGVLSQIDMAEIFRRIGLPLKDPTQLAIEQQQLANQPTQVPNVPGVTIANPNVNPGFTAGGSAPQVTGAGNTFTTAPGTVAAGFSDDNPQYIYIQPTPEIDIELTDVSEFLSSLPSSKHYGDKAIRALTVQMRRLWLGHFRRLYPDFAKYLHSLDKIELEDDVQQMLFADIGKARAEKAAKKIMANYAVNAKVLRELAANSASLLRKLLERAAKLEMDGIRLHPELEKDAFDSFLQEQTGRLINFTHTTFNNEVRAHLINEIQAGKSSKEIADGLVARFENMPLSKADRIARSETRDAVNAASLIVSEAAKIRYVKAKDGQLGPTDADCEKRDGKLFTVREAWKQLRKEHPYGTLGFEPIPRAEFSIESVATLPEAAYAGLNGNSDLVAAWFDAATCTAYVPINLSEAETDEFLTAVVETF